MLIKENKKVIYAVTVILATFSILYELLLAQTISFFASYTVVWYSLVLGLYLGAMGVGALSFNKIFKRKNYWLYLFRVEFILSVLGGVSVLIVHLAHMFLSFVWSNQSFLNGIILFYSLVLFIVVAVGFLTGLELPLLISIAREIEHKKNITNMILGADYFGCLMGAVIFPLFLVSKFDNFYIAFYVGLGNLSMAVLILFICLWKEKKFARRAILTFVLLILLGSGVRYNDQVQQYLLKQYYYHNETSLNKALLLSTLSEFPFVNRVHSPYQKIDLVEYPYQKNQYTDLWETYSEKFKVDPQHPRGHVLFLDGAYQFTIDIEEIYHEYFAHVPIQFSNKVPENVLILGAGDGLLVREIVKYKDIKNITLVEIDSKMIELSRSNPNLVHANKNALDDQRIKMVEEDAYQFVRNAIDKYDAIYIDFPQAKDYNLSKLYSREFYHFVNRCLTESGFAVVDAPEIRNNNLIKEMWPVYQSTLHMAGFKDIVPYFSNLETDNTEARSLVKDYVGESLALEVWEEGSPNKSSFIRGREKIIDYLLNDYVNRHRHGFIFLPKELHSLNTNFVNYNIPLYVLNNQRFANVLDGSLGSSNQISLNRVNSIMKPKLPLISEWWQVRVPY